MYKMMIEDLDSVFEVSPYNPRKCNSPPRSASSSQRASVVNGSSLPSDLHLALTPDCPHTISDSDPALKKDKESKIKKWKKRLSDHIRKTSSGSGPSSPMMSAHSSSSIGLRPHASLPDMKPKARTLPSSKAYSKQLNGYTSPQKDEVTQGVKQMTMAADHATNGGLLFNPRSNDEIEEEVFHNVLPVVPRKTRKLSEIAKPSSQYGRLESYSKLEELGEGSYATVFKAISRVTGNIVALKEIRLNSAEGTPFTAIREASLLKGLKHANIVTLHDIIHIPGNLTFVFEYVEIDLCRYMEKHPGPMSPNNVMLLTFQLLRGLVFCHERKVLHRDLKPQNILLNSMGELKLADFGLARAKSVPSRTYSHEVVTVWYRPPDVLLGSTKYSTSLDMWGVGCIFVEMLCGHPLFPGLKGIQDQLTKIFKVLGTPSEETWPGVTSLPEFKKGQFKNYSRKELGFVIPDLVKATGAEPIATALLQLRPGLRISAKDALYSPYFTSVLPKAIYAIDNCASIYLVPSVKFER
ncbi:cyclin-dependent kinase 5 homolog isoform X2 [Dysidea avara]|uniref:cyclin-dependent kinase 5 homolog isoform X2 n=1 Tax=Dysidea avara TaxID=196820 RepID=UPI00332B7F01